MGGNLDGSCIRRSSTSLICCLTEDGFVHLKRSATVRPTVKMYRKQKSAPLSVLGVFMQEWIEAQQTMESACFFYDTMDGTLA